MPQTLFKPYEPTELDKALDDLVKRLSMIQGAGYQTGIPPQPQQERGEFLNRPNFFDPEVGPPDVTKTPRAMRSAQKPGEEVVVPRIVSQPEEWTERTPPEMRKETIGPAKRWQKPGVWEKTAAAGPTTFLETIPQVAYSAGEAVKGIGKQAAGVGSWAASVAAKAALEPYNLIFRGASPKRIGESVDRWFEKHVNRYFEPSTPEQKAGQAPLEVFFAMFGTGIDKGAGLLADATLLPFKEVSPQLRDDVKEIYNLIVQGVMVSHMAAGSLDKMNMRRAAVGKEALIRPAPIDRAKLAEAKKIAKRVAKGEQFDVLQELKSAGFDVDTLIKNRENILADLEGERARYPEAFPEGPVWGKEGRPGQKISTPSVSVEAGGKTITIVPEYGGKTTVKVEEAAPAATTTTPTVLKQPEGAPVKKTLLQGAGVKGEPAPAKVETKTTIVTREPGNDGTTGRATYRRVAYREPNSYGPDNFIRVDPREIMKLFKEKILETSRKLKDGKIRNPIKAFGTIEELADFVAAHELSHGLPEFQFKNKGDAMYGKSYTDVENAINKAILEGLRPPQQEALAKMIKGEIERMNRGEWTEKTSNAFSERDGVDKITLDEMLKSQEEPSIVNLAEQEKRGGIIEEEWQDEGFPETTTKTTAVAAKGEKGKVVVAKTEPAPAPGSMMAKMNDALHRKIITKAEYDAFAARWKEASKSGAKKVKEAQDRLEVTLNKAGYRTEGAKIVKIEKKPAATTVKKTTVERPLTEDEALDRAMAERDKEMGEFPEVPAETVEVPEKAPGRPAEARSQATPTPTKGKPPSDVANALKDVDEMSWVEWKDDANPELRDIAEKIEAKEREVETITGQRYPAFKFGEEIAGLARDVALDKTERAEVVKLNREIASLMNEGLQVEKAVRGSVYRPTYPGQSERDVVGKVEGPFEPVKAKEIPEGWSKEWPPEEVPKFAGKTVVEPTVPTKTTTAGLEPDVYKKANSFFSKIDDNGEAAFSGINSKGEPVPVITGEEISALTQVFGKEESRGIKRILKRQADEGRYGEFTEPEARAFTVEYNKLRDRLPGAEGEPPSVLYKKGYGSQTELASKGSKKVVTEPSTPTQYELGSEPLTAAEMAKKETRHAESRAKKTAAATKMDQMSDRVVGLINKHVEDGSLRRIRADYPGLPPEEAKLAVAEHRVKILRNLNSNIAKGKIDISEIRYWEKQLELGKISQESFNSLVDKSQFARIADHYAFRASRGYGKEAAAWTFGDVVPDEIQNEKAMAILDSIKGGPREELVHNKFAILDNEASSAVSDAFWGIGEPGQRRTGGFIEQFIKDTSPHRRAGIPDEIIDKKIEALTRYADGHAKEKISAELDIPASTLRDTISQFEKYMADHVDDFIDKAKEIAKTRYDKIIETSDIVGLKDIPSFDVVFQRNAKAFNDIFKEFKGTPEEQAQVRAAAEKAKARRAVEEKVVEETKKKAVQLPEEKSVSEALKEEGFPEVPEDVYDAIAKEREAEYDGIDDAGLGKEVKDKVAEYFSNMMKSSEQRAKERVKASGIWEPERQEARETWDSSMVKRKKTIAEKMGHAVDEVNRGFRRMFGTLDKNNPIDSPMVAHLVKHQNNIFIGRQLAEKIINGEVLGVIDRAVKGRTKIRLLRTYNDYIALRDMYGQAMDAFQKKNTSYRNPYFKTSEELLGEWERLNDVIDSMPDKEKSILKQAVSARDAAFNKLRDEYISEAKKAGYKNVDKLFADPTYFRREVLQYYLDKQSETKGWRKGLSSNLKPLNIPRLRGGHTMPWDLDTARVDADVLSRLFYEKETLKLHNFAKDNYDIFPEFSKEFEARGLDRNTFIKQLDKRGWVSPDGTKYVAFWPERTNFVYTAKTIPERLARDISMGNLEEMVKDRGLQEMWGDLSSNIRDALAIGERKDPWMIPEHIAKALQEFSRPTPRSNIGTMLGGMPLTAWKKWTLFGPMRYAKYSFRNLTGDLEAVVIGNPQALKRVFGENGVAKNLAHYFKGDSSKMDPVLKDYMDTWGYGSSFHRTEFSQIQKLANLDKAFSKIPSAAAFPFDAARSVWKGWMGFAERAADIREGVLRAANYMEYYDQISRNFEKTGKMVPDNYGASNPTFIDSLQTIKEKSYHLSNDLCGAYDMISPMGQKLRSGPIPFWSWKEITMKRYYNLARNAALDPKSNTKLGSTFIKGAPFAAARVGKFIVKANLLMTAVQLMNQFIDPEGEANLPQDVKSKPHINLTDGHYFPSIGMGSDLIDFFGAEAPPQMVWDLAHGNLTMDQIVNRWWKDKPWVNHMFQSINPFAKLGMELATKRKLYPNMFTARGIRDPYEHIANAFQMGDVYRAAFDRPGKQNDYKKFIASLFDYQHDPYETAYFDWLKRVNDYKKTHGSQTIGYSITDKSNNLYWFKRARLENDPESAKKFFKRWLVASFQEGGLRGKSPDEITKGLTQSLQQSYRVMNPLYHLTPYEIADLARQMTPDEKRMLAMAMGYWTHVLVGNEDANIINDKMMNDEEE